MSLIDASCRVLTGCCRRLAHGLFDAIKVVVVANLEHRLFDMLPLSRTTSFDLSTFSEVGHAAKTNQ